VRIKVLTMVERGMKTWGGVEGRVKMVEGSVEVCSWRFEILK
jgi:hypothetical protein